MHVQLAACMACSSCTELHNSRGPQGCAASSRLQAALIHQHLIKLAAHARVQETSHLLRAMKMAARSAGGMEEC